MNRRGQGKKKGTFWFVGPNSLLQTHAEYARLSTTLGRRKED